MRESRDPFSLAGKVVLVTGGSSGIGASMATAFAAQGAKIALHYRTPAHGEAAVQRILNLGGACIPFRADLLDHAEPPRLVESVVSNMGGLDIVINNAGDIVQRRPIVDLDCAYIEKVMQLNCVAAAQICTGSIPALRSSKGCIINISSLGARLGGLDGAAVYASAKGALNTFTRTCAMDFARDGVRVNAISPGFIDTPFHQRHTSREGLDARRRGNPMGRIGTPEDCLGAALFLSSESMSGYITGQVIEVNGGQFMP